MGEALRTACARMESVLITLGRILCRRQHLQRFHEQLETVVEQSALKVSKVRFSGAARQRVAGLPHPDERAEPD